MTRVKRDSVEEARWGIFLRTGLVIRRRRRNLGWVYGEGLGVSLAAPTLLV